jgi:hypothetical protein
MQTNGMSMNGRFQRRAGALAVGAVLAACSGSGSGTGTNADPMGASSGHAAALAEVDSKDPRVLEWQKAIKKVKSPELGCFEARYPSMIWTEVPCGARPTVSMPSHGPPRAAAEQPGPKPDVVSPAPSSPANAGSTLAPFTGGSNGGDYFAQMSGSIYEANGTFTSVSGDNTNAGYSIQLNTNQFTVPSDVSICPGCQGWQQGVLSASQGAFIEYWIFNQSVCNIFGGWVPENGGCYYNGPHIQNLPSLSLTQLQGVTMQMDVSTNDTLLITIGGTVYRTSETSVLGLDQTLWTQAQFGVYGDAGSHVNLSTPTAITMQLDAEAPSSVKCVTSVSGGATGETNNLNETCCLDDSSGQPGITYEESTSGQACGFCGGPGQPCCTLPQACASASNVCYSNTCEPCGGNGQLCCANSTCTAAGNTCQQGLCGLPSGLTVSPSVISAAASDGAGLSVNYASTQATLTGAWAGSVAPTFTYAGLPSNGSITCSPNGIPPSEGPSTITCTTSTSAPLGTYHVTVTAQAGSYPSQSAQFTLNVTQCQPLTCSGIGYVCGALDSGCGYSENCGSCPSGETCTAGSCYKCAERTCPVPEFFNLDTCECQACPCGTLHVDGHYLCAICR